MSVEKEITQMQVSLGKIETHVLYIREEMERGDKKFEEIDKRCERRRLNNEKEFKGFMGFKNKLLGLALGLSAAVTMAINYLIRGGQE